MGLTVADVAAVAELTLVGRCRAGAPHGCHAKCIHLLTSGHQACMHTRSSVAALMQCETRQLGARPQWKCTGLLTPKLCCIVMSFRHSCNQWWMCMQKVPCRDCGAMLTYSYKLKPMCAPDCKRFWGKPSMSMLLLA